MKNPKQTQVQTHHENSRKGNISCNSLPHTKIHFRCIEKTIMPTDYECFPFRGRWMLQREGGREREGKQSRAKKIKSHTELFTLFTPFSFARAKFDPLPSHNEIN